MKSRPRRLKLFASETVVCGGGRIPARVALFVGVALGLLRYPRLIAISDQIVTMKVPRVGLVGLTLVTSSGIVSLDLRSR